MIKSGSSKKEKKPSGKTGVKAVKPYHGGVPKATARAPRRMVTAAAEATAGNGFSSAYSQKAADDLNYT